MLDDHKHCETEVIQSLKTVSCFMLKVPSQLKKTRTHLVIKSLEIVHIFKKREGVTSEKQTQQLQKDQKHKCRRVAGS